MVMHPSPAPAHLPAAVQAALGELRLALRALYGDAAPALWLYGSYARGEATAASDVDVLLLYADEVQPGHEINRLRGVLADLNLRYQVLVSVLPVSRQRYQAAQGAFWQCVQREGVSLEAG